MKKVPLDMVSSGPADECNDVQDTALLILFIELITFLMGPNA